MKTKTAHETAGIGPGHRYLGHFAKPRFINQGHNDTPMNEKKGTVTIVEAPSAKQGRAFNDTEPTYDKGFGLPKPQHNMDPGIHTPLPTTTRDRNESNPSDAMDRRLLRPKVRM